MKIFVTNFSEYIGEEALRALFKRYGRIRHLEMIYDSDFRERRGAVVDMPHRDAKRAIRHLRGRVWKGERLRMYAWDGNSELV